MENFLEETITHIHACNIMTGLFALYSHANRMSVYGLRFKYIYNITVIISQMWKWFINTKKQNWTNDGTSVELENSFYVIRIKVIILFDFVTTWLRQSVRFLFPLIVAMAGSQGFVRAFFEAMDEADPGHVFNAIEPFFHRDFIYYRTSRGFSGTASHPSSNYKLKSKKISD